MSGSEGSGSGSSSGESSSASPRKENRDTASGCRERAAAGADQAAAAGTVNGRRVFEQSSASWTTRAAMLERLESGMKVRRAAPHLTQAEVAEDAASAASDAPDHGVT